MTEIRSPKADLTGWSSRPRTAAGYTHEVLEKGTGPGVILMPEVPGVHPAVLALGNHLVDNGFTVVIPSLFGTPGKARGKGYAVRTIARLCLSREFKAFAVGAERPVANYLRQLALELNGRTPGVGVGVIGMCFTGGFALAAAVDANVSASVLSQPAVPFPLTSRQRSDPGVSCSELQGVKDRATQGEVSLVGLRFANDWKAPRERMEFLKNELGDAIEVIPLDSTPSNPYGFTRGAHSVLTDEVRAVAGHPAFEARARVVAFLQQRLSPKSDGVADRGQA